MRVCIVVPCYNEERRLPVAAFDSYLAKVANVSFVLVNDGSTDGTLQVLRGLVERWPGRVSALDQPKNAGKAEAVRCGLQHALRSDAEVVGYWDADLATPLEAIDQLAQVLVEEPKVNFVLGARVALLGRAIERSPLRHYLGRIFATAASVTLGLPVYDTQCGAKMLRVVPETRGLFEKPFMSRWIFDVELVARYLQAARSALGLFEYPLHAWRDVGESKVKPRDFIRAIAELWAIYREYRGQRSSNS